ncbi:MAG: sulfurtransferase-like selenium metabolism protein YedF [Bacteroidales bacterium]|jgi:selenium metabolism protein YedF|nr:sulfurtransferase-like selenium metabolism protein YedF [Bacteroidales bacterium]
MKVVDTRGLTCPAPLIRTRQGLTEAAPDEDIQVLIDNPVSLSNVKRFLSDNKLSFSVKEEGGLAIVTVSRGDKSGISANETEYCTTETPASSPGKRNTVVAVTSERMGSGDDVLGTKLMMSFFRTLVMLEPAPDSVVFYNAGVKLALDDSPLLEHIRELIEKGTAIYLCSTCINHFGIKDHLPVGSFSDMYQILNILKDADHIIRP